MFHQSLRVLLMLSLAMLASLPAQAQTAKAEQAKLATYQKKLQKLQVSHKQSQAELAKSRAAIKSMHVESSPEKTELDESVKRLKEAQATYDADPSEENKARLNNEEFKQALAERKFKKANAEYYDLQDKIDRLSKQVQQTDSEISKLKAGIAEQKIAVQDAQDKEAAARAARQAAKERQKAEAAAAEIARLKAQLAEQQRKEAARKAAEAQAAKPAKPAAPTAAGGMPAPAMPKPAVAVQPAPASPQAPAIKQPVAESAPAPAQPAPAKPATPATPAKPAASSGAFMLLTREEVAAEQQRLKQVLATPDNDKNHFNKILNVKPVLAGGETGPARAHTLRALGHGQFKGDADLKGGEVIFVIGFNRWRQTLPKTPDGTQYVVTLDTSNPKQPRLFYYQKALAE